MDSEAPRCPCTVTFLSRLALEGIVGAAVGAPVAQQYSVSDWATVLGSYGHDRAIWVVRRLIGVRLGYNIYGLDIR